MNPLSMAIFNSYVSLPEGMEKTNECSMAKHWRFPWDFKDEIHWLWISRDFMSEDGRFNGIS
jgi:hypothetical protein